MPRMTPKEAIKRLRSKQRPLEILDYNPVEHEEEMQDMMTGLAGAVLSLGVPSLSGPQIGSRIPAVVTNTDVIRLFIIDEVYEMKKEKPRAISFGAFTYTGEYEQFDTDHMLTTDSDALAGALIDAISAYR